jgi:parvulin-like peptidyl-prolyl isomerase
MDTRSRTAHRSRVLRAAAAAPLLAFAALAAGCSNDAGVLARVGERAIARDEFAAIAQLNATQYPGEPDSAKRLMLEDLVRRELLLAEGRRLGFDRDPALAELTEGADEEVLEQALFERIAPRDVPVSEAEVERLHAWRRQQSRLRVIYTPGRAVAQAAADAVRGGMPFAAAAERFSAPGMLPPGGDLGWIASGQLVNPLDRVAREAPVGVPQGPLEAPGEGWFVVLVEERRTQEPAPLDQERPFLADMLRQRKSRAVAMRAFEQLSRAYRVEVGPHAPQALYRRLNLGPEEAAQADALGHLPGDSSEVLATWTGGRYTLTDALADGAHPRRQRPPANSTAALRSWVESMVVQRAALAEARRRHLAEEPEVARRLRSRHDNALLQLTYQRLVAETVRISEDDVRALYAERAAQFHDLPFEQLPAPLVQNLASEASGRRQERRLSALTDSLRATTRVELFPQRLRAVAWPAPPPASDLPGMPPPGALAP